MEQNTEQADALMKCVEVAPSYSKITQAAKQVCRGGFVVNREVE